MKEYNSASEVLSSRTVLPSRQELETEIGRLNKIKVEHGKDLNALGIHLLDIAISVHDKDLSVYTGSVNKLGDYKTPARLLAEAQTAGPNQMDKLGSLVYLQTNAIVWEPALSDENKKLMNNLENTLKRDIKNG